MDWLTPKRQVAYAKPLRHYVDQLRSVGRQIEDDSYTITPLQEKSVIESCHTIREVLIAMTPAAFTLSPKHGVAWTSATQSAGMLSELYPYKSSSSPTTPRKMSKAEEFGLYFHELLKQLIAFEDAFNN